MNSSKKENGIIESMKSASDPQAAASNEESYSWSEEDDDGDNQTIGSVSSMSRPLVPSSSFSHKADGAAVESSAAKPVSASSSAADPMQMHGLPRLDILCGRGKPIQEHPGNKRMHTIIQWHKQIYQKAGRGIKKSVIMEVLEQVKQPATTTEESRAASSSRTVSSTSLEEPHRFLFRCQTAPGVFEWQEATEAMAIKKIAHGLRGKPPPPAAGGPTSGNEDDRRTFPKFASLQQDFDPEEPGWTGSSMFPIHQTSISAIQSGRGAPQEQEQNTSPSIDGRLTSRPSVPQLMDQQHKFSPTASLAATLGNRSPPAHSSLLLRQQQEQQQHSACLISLKSSFTALQTAHDGNHNISNRQNGVARLWVDGATTSATTSSSQVAWATSSPDEDPRLGRDPKLEGQNTGDKEEFSSCEIMFSDPGESPPSPSIF